MTSKNLFSMGKVKTFEIIFDDNKTVYYPGQSVTGKCVVDLRGDLKMRTLKIFLHGVAKVHWTESRSTGNRLGAYTEHYNAEIEYFFKKQILFGSEAGDSREVLSEGQHKFNFSFQLPTSGLSTSFEGKYGSIRYWLKAEMEKPWTFNHKTKRAFTVISPININRMEYLVPVENSGEKQLCCWCCMAGPITITARTDRKGYCPGESIAITADFENGSGRTVVPHATLHQTQMFLAGGKARSRRLDFTRVTGLAVQPRRTASWDAQLLKIPAVSPSILNCCLIRVDYSVRLTLQIPGAYNLSLDLPVVIGTSPLRLPRLLVAPPGEEELETFPPPYHESSPATPLSEPPPTYAECIEGSVDIDDEEEDGAEMVGDTRFTPMFPYVHNYQPPPAYSEVDPHPVGDR